MIQNKHTQLMTNVAVNESCATTYIKSVAANIEMTIPSSTYVVRMVTIMKVVFIMQARLLFKQK